jgi:hypothetical protein
MHSARSHPQTVECWRGVRKVRSCDKKLSNSKNLVVALAHQAKNLSNDKMVDELRSLVSVTFVKFHIYVSAICKENLCFFECEGDIGNPLSSKKN